MTQQPDGVIRWTSPAGHDHTTHPEHPFIERTLTPAPARDPVPERDEHAA
jgi:hypothetical protein